MAEERIDRKDLWQQLSQIEVNDWIKAAQKLGLNVTQPKGGSSHYAIRKPDYDKSNIKGLICTVYKGMRKDTNEIAFKKFIEAGFDEDKIWKALDMLN